jgi:PAS domain S-box-containing protein
MSDFQAKLEALFAKSSEPVVIVREPQGEVLAANDAACRALGYPPGGLVGLKRTDLCDQTDPRHLEARARWTTEGTASGRTSFRRRDGSFLEAQRTANAFVSDTGETLLLVTFNDLSDQLRAEAAQRESEEKLRALCDATDESIIIHDGTHVLFTNTAAEKLYGEGSLAGRRLTDFVAPESLPIVFENVSKGNDGAYELRGRRADGSTFPGQVQVRTITYRGERYRVVAVTDITARKEMELRLALADRMASLGTLAAGVAHEINNPLTFVMGNIDVALGALEGGAEGASSAMRDALLDARLGAERVRKIVEQMRAFSRASEETAGPVDLARVVRDAAALANGELRHRAQLRLELEDVPPVTGTEARLGQVALNLIVNAAQAIDEGHAEANEVVVRARREGASHVALSVSDTGRGIAPELRTRVFDPFVTTKGAGTGLGLSIVHTIVTSFGGTIDVESELGHGSTFRVRLPIAHVEAAPVSRRRPSEPAPPRSGRARILIVDDEPLLRNLVVRVLEPEHRVIAFGAARDALAHIETGARVDVVLCDLMMPEMTGMDLHEALLERAPEVARRVLFLTGGVFTERAHRFLAGGDVPYLHKPFSIPDLLAAIERVRALNG